MKRTGQLALVLALAACKGRDDHASHVQAEDRSVRTSTAVMDDLERDQAGADSSAMALEEGKLGKKDLGRADGQFKMRAEKSPRPSAPAGALGGAAADLLVGQPVDKNGDPGTTAPTEAAPTRAWFPETFLFEPLVVTDATGLAQVSVKVPDRLTTWRVLALAHSRSGAQGGAVTSFLGTLPVYVDPIVPPKIGRAHV